MQLPQKELKLPADFIMTDKSIEIITFDLNKDLSTTKDVFKLKPYDKVFIRSLPNYKAQKLVQITGEVNYPGSYAIQNEVEHISDMIDRANGLRTEAYVKGAKFYRNNVLVFVDFEKALKNKNSASNLLLEDGDRIEIPKEKQTVTVSGQVLSPTTVAYQPSFSFKEYIGQAGGFTDSAFIKKTYVRYANGSTNRTHSFIGIKAFPKVKQGMTIFVPVKNRVRMSPAERIAISTGLISVSAVLLTLIRLL
jgi:polysaccharide biosynthesis/export protein